MINIARKLLRNLLHVLGIFTILIVAVALLGVAALFYASHGYRIHGYGDLGTVFPDVNRSRIVVPRPLDLLDSQGGLWRTDNKPKVFRSAKEWQVFYSKAAHTSPPIVDFEHDLVVVLTNWGAAPEVFGGVEEQGKFVIGYRTHSDFMDTLGIAPAVSLTVAAPYLFPKTSLPIVFRNLHWTFQRPLHWSRSAREP
ncbi:MAG: hypothetical protein A2V88_06275 [Elusimicrobia bacterium RBG_16_66_12]|nr:MAG: hypothetical protein A2V88_06275 [Elusimicrobia bacterium RBG_16_66_12]